MCFSAEASFILGTVLVSGGAVCVASALKTERRYVPMALFPVFAGVQQIAEGAVWTGLEQACTPAVTGGSYTFLFFAWMMWSFWVPFMAWCVEKDRAHKWLLGGFMAAGGVWGALMYLPYFAQFGSVSAEIVHNAIYYTDHMWLEQYIPREAIFFIYLSIAGVAPMASSNIWVKLFGVGLLIAAQISYAFYLYAATSVMCFFACVLTLYLMYIVVRDKAGLRA